MNYESEIKKSTTDTIGGKWELLIKGRPTLREYNGYELVDKKTALRIARAFDYHLENCRKELKQARLDAAKWGAKQAAEHVSMQGVGIDPLLMLSCGQKAYRYRGCMKQSILTFANNLTADQLPK